MASSKSTGDKTKTKGQKPSRASAMPPKPPAPPRAQGGPTTLVPKPPLVGGHHANNPEKRGSAGGLGAGPQDSGATDAVLADDDGNIPLKKQELIAQVVARSDVAKKHAKPVIEAMLAVLGDALSEGRDLNLQPMGKIKRKRIKDTDKARIIVANIRQSKAAGAGSATGAPPLPGSTPGSMIAPAKEAVADSEE
ncbi:HU family DNA-binding protein [Roseovarius sp. Pro17]|uniref:HU family DNA-binding protein n=1 Tax=Roseovarius sp. Pro17 TaxID=3108175 RepID=UPI002D79899C|nr:HU family DNA-binding protein [Roseovarius sp. Pro17]